MGFSRFLIIVAAFCTVLVNATLYNCIDQCYEKVATEQLYCKFDCFKKFTFGGYTLNDKKGCYIVCDSVPTINRNDCKLGCDFIFSEYMKSK